jgi:hypothetical protein
VEDPQQPRRSRIGQSGPVPEAPGADIEAMVAENIWGLGIQSLLGSSVNTSCLHITHKMFMHLATRS